ncbi:MAG: sulfotransferase [Candidatus Marinimicrobia bacterium]|nr:sulfotransferase [Candidatus Neomarinimicrobiota bacterium]
MKGPLFILGLHKSGTSLVRSLLDGHPGLTVLPVETHPFQHFGYEIHYNYRRQFAQNLSREEIIRRCREWILRCNTADDPLTDSVTPDLFDESCFVEKMADISGEVSHRARDFTLYWNAMYASYNNGKNIPEDTWLCEKSVEHAEFAAELKYLFPEAVFIHIVRNPYANIVSLRRFKDITTRFPKIDRVIQTMDNSYYYLLKNIRMLPDYHVIRYCDLVSSPRETLTGLCKKLKIPFKENLLYPTSHGKLWDGNSTSGEKFTGISSSRLSEWKKLISPVEASIINTRYGALLEMFDYEPFSVKGSLYRPVKGENLVRYVYNRLVLNLRSI